MAITVITFKLCDPTLHELSLFLLSFKKKITGWVKKTKKQKQKQKTKQKTKTAIIGWGLYIKNKEILKK